MLVGFKQRVQSANVGILVKLPTCRGRMATAAAQRRITVHPAGTGCPIRTFARNRGLRGATLANSPDRANSQIGPTVKSGQQSNRVNSQIGSTVKSGQQSNRANSQIGPTVKSGQVKLGQVSLTAACAQEPTCAGSYFESGVKRFDRQGIYTVRRRRSVFVGAHQGNRLGFGRNRRPNHHSGFVNHQWR